MAKKKVSKKKTSKKTVRKKAAKKAAKPRLNRAAKPRLVNKGPKRLYRAAEKDSMLGGVCAGIAEYTNTDPVLIRLIALVLALFEGLGILAYIIAWIVMPRK